MFEKVEMLWNQIWLPWQRGVLPCSQNATVTCTISQECTIHCLFESQQMQVDCNGTLLTGSAVSVTDPRVWGLSNQSCSIHQVSLFLFIACALIVLRSYRVPGKIQILPLMWVWALLALASRYDRKLSASFLTFLQMWCDGYSVNSSNFYETYLSNLTLSQCVVSWVSSLFVCSVSFSWFRFLARMEMILAFCKRYDYPNGWALTLW